MSLLVDLEKKEAKEKQPKSKKRTFRGWKATIRCKTKEFSVNVPIRYQKLTSISIEEEMKIVLNSKTLKTEDGVRIQVERKLLGDYHYGYQILDKEIVQQRIREAIQALKDKGEWEISTEEQFYDMTERANEIPKDDLGYYQTIDGEEKEVQQFERTKDFEIAKFADKSKMWTFLLEGFYEIWSEENGLWILADYLQRTKQLGVCTHIVLRKSFKEYYGLIFPIVLDGKYTLILVLTRMNLKYNHLKPASFVEAKKEKPKDSPKSALQIEL